MHWPSGAPSRHKFACGSASWSVYRRQPLV
jgi:hypothetical protein